MWRRVYLSLVGLGALILSGCAEPWIWLEPSDREMKMLQDGGYCRDQWGRVLSSSECAQQTEAVGKEQLKPK